MVSEMKPGQGVVSEMELSAGHFQEWIPSWGNTPGVYGKTPSKDSFRTDRYIIVRFRCNVRDLAASKNTCIWLLKCNAYSSMLYSHEFVASFKILMLYFWSVSNNDI